MSAASRRRRRQAGTTLVEVLVSVMIMGLALVLIVGALSTGLLNATLAKRNTAVQAVVQYELGRVGSSQFSTNAQPFSECFATDTPTVPAVIPNYQGSCPPGQFTMRADMAWTAGSSSNVQLWTITIVAWPDGSDIGQPISYYKVNR